MIKRGMAEVMRRWSLNLTLLILSTVLALLLVEGLVRLFNLAPGIQVETWEVGRKRVVSGPEFKYYAQINSMGVRDYREFGRRSKSRRIIFLGDSFVFGLGVSNHETFASLTEALLNDRSAHSWTIINAGRSGTGTIRQQELLERILCQDKIEVNGVVLFYFVDNDPYETMRESHALRPRGNHTRQTQVREPYHSQDHLNTVKEWSKGHLAIYRFLKLKLGTVGTLRAFPYSIFDQCDPEKLSSFAEIDKLTKRVIAQMKFSLQEKKVDFSVVIIPRAEQISDEAFQTDLLQLEAIQKSRIQ